MRSGAVGMLTETRARTLLLVSRLSEEDLTIQHSPLMGPIVWDLGHIAHFEELWLVRNIGNGTEPGQFTEIPGDYNPFENPRSVRGKLKLPGLGEAMTTLAAIRGRVLGHLETLRPDDDDPLLENDCVFHLVAQHEYQHCETILQTLQLKRGERYQPPRLTAVPEPVLDGLIGEMVRFPGGRVPIGTDDPGAAYDNERPRHEVSLDAFLIDAAPVTNGEYRSFVDGGGYDSPEHWSEAGWAWREEEGLEAPLYWERTADGWQERLMDRVVPLDPLRPVCHVCYYEAEAYARANGKRLPTEQEWEAAASWDSATGSTRTYPWGDDASAAHANIDQQSFETAPVGAYPANVSPIGCYGMIGDVWEWTASDFDGYPGFRSYPYREYSEVFFGDDYKVLRGGSWATRVGAIRNTFRNWDYPIRRQIFSGFRCVRDD